MKLQAIIAAVALFSAGWAVEAQACGGKKKSGEVARQAPASAAKVVLAVDGMSCGSCAAKIADTLKKLDGVYTARVDFAKKQAVVQFAPKKVTVGKLVKAVADLGYKVKVQAKRGREA